MLLPDALTAARAFRLSLDPGDVIDDASGFSALHLDHLIEWAETCNDVVATAEDREGLQDMDLSQLGESGLADFYFRELEIDPALDGEAGRRLTDEVERRGLTEEQLAAAHERTRRQHEAVAAAELAEAPPHFPDDLEIPKPS